MRARHRPALWSGGDAGSVPHCAEKINCQTTFRGRGVTASKRRMGLGGGRRGRLISIVLCTLVPRGSNPGQTPGLPSCRLEITAASSVLKLKSAWTLDHGQLLFTELRRRDKHSFPPTCLLYFCWGWAESCIFRFSARQEVCSEAGNWSWWRKCLKRSQATRNRSVPSSFNKNAN